MIYVFLVTPPSRWNVDKSSINIMLTTCLQYPRVNSCGRLSSNWCVHLVKHEASCGPPPLPAIPSLLSTCHHRYVPVRQLLHMYVDLCGSHCYKRMFAIRLPHTYTWNIWGVLVNRPTCQTCVSWSSLARGCRSRGDANS